MSLFGKLFFMRKDKKESSKLVGELSDYMESIQLRRNLNFRKASLSGWKGWKSNKFRQNLILFSDFKITNGAKHKRAGGFFYCCWDAVALNRNKSTVIFFFSNRWQWYFKRKFTVCIVVLRPHQKYGWDTSLLLNCIVVSCTFLPELKPVTEFDWKFCFCFFFLFHPMPFMVLKFLHHNRCN